MIRKTTLVSSLAGLGILLGVVSGKAVAQMPHDAVSPDAPQHTGQFHQVDQPLWIKTAVTVGGLGLISLEFWWFLLSKPKARQPGIQEVNRRASYR